MDRWMRGAFCVFGMAVIAGCRSGSESSAIDGGPRASAPSPAPATSAPHASTSARLAPPAAAVSVAATSAPVAAAPSASSDGSGKCPNGMIFIAGATFTMGAANPKDDPIEADYAESDRAGITAVERPAHRATVQPFCIDRTEVTTAAYAACVERGRCQPTQPPAADSVCNQGLADRANHPINCVSWIDARNYCLSSGFRLPSEREWEYAARSGDKRWYPWGKEDPLYDPPHYCGDHGQKTTCAVGSFPIGKSPFGLDDMAGNVAEWTLNSFCKYPKDDCGNPDDDRVYRSNGFKLGGDKVRVTARSHAPHSFTSVELGFRCAAPPKS